MMGVLIHVLGDCANNVGVIIAAAVIWFAHYEGRYYADPAVSMGIAVMIFLSSIPLSKFHVDYPCQCTRLTTRQSDEPVSFSFKARHRESTTTM